MCIKTRFQCMNPDCLARDTCYNECMAFTTCITSITIVDRADGCCKCVYKDEQEPCIHRARQLHPQEVSRLQTRSHLAEANPGNEDVFSSSDEGSDTTKDKKTAACRTEQDESGEAIPADVEQEDKPENDSAAQDANGHQEDDHSSVGSVSLYETESMMFEMEDV